MVCPKFDAEWLVREALTHETFIFEFLERNSKNEFVWGKGLVREMLHHLVDVGGANRLLRLGFRRHGLRFVNSRLFEAFIKVHLHRVL